MARKRRRGAIVCLAVFAIFLALWVCTFVLHADFQAGPNAKSFGGDFALFFSAANVVRDGGNPFDQHALYGTEARILRAQGVPIPPFQAFMRVGNPPLLYWALQPLTHLPFRTGALLWIIGMETLLILSSLFAFSYFGWRERLVPSLLFLAMPQTIMATYYGNVDALVFIGLAAALATARKHPSLAGALLTLGFLKPPIALPLVMLVLLFHVPDRKRVMVSFALTAFGGLVMTAIVMGPLALQEWWAALTHYSNDVAVQPDLSSLAGLYVYQTSRSMHTLIAIALFTAACALTAATWWRLRSRPSVPFYATGWLWFVWFLVAPFGHFHDQVLLLFPILASIGSAGANVLRARSLAVLWMMGLSIFLFPVSRLQVDPQSLLLLAILVILFHQAVPALRRVQERSSTCAESGRDSEETSAIQVIRDMTARRRVG